MFAETVELTNAFADITEYWSPKIVAQVNNQYVKLAKVHGHLTWHNHRDEDELFYVVKGNLIIEYESGKSIHLPPGSMHVVPRGVMHNPVAEEECWIMLIEPVTTKHTGDVEIPLTKTIEQQLT